MSPEQVRGDSEVDARTDVYVAPAGGTLTREVRLIPTPQFAADYRAHVQRQRLLALAIAGTGVLAGGVALAFYVDNEHRFEPGRRARPSSIASGPRPRVRRGPARSPRPKRPMTTWVSRSWRATSSRSVSGSPAGYWSAFSGAIPSATAA